MPTLTLVNSFLEDVFEGKHDFSADQIKIALTNTLPTVTDTVLDTVTAHPPPTNANGYTAGGNVATVTGSSQASGTYKLVLADTVFTASGGTLGPFQYIVVYNEDAASNEMIGFADVGSSVTLNNGQTFTTNFDETEGVLQVSAA